MRLEWFLVLFCSLGLCKSVDFNHFWNTSEIEDFLQEVNDNSSSSIDLRTLKSSWEYRHIWQIRIGKNLKRSDNRKKPVIVVEAGLRARDWIANMAAVRLIKELTDNSTKHESVDWVILPNLNPDGFLYTWTTDRHWIKNRRFRVHNTTNCAGVSLNRNFDLNWNGLASSIEQCSDYYAGPWPMSEDELIALLLTFHEYGTRIKAYVSLQTAGSYILSPYFFTDEIQPKNWEQQQALAEKMRDAIFNETGHVYEAVQGNKVFQTTGNSMDYFSVVKSTPYPYTILLPAAKTGQIHEHSPDEIEPITQQVLVAMEVLGEHIGKTYKSVEPPPPQKWKPMFYGAVSND